MERARKNRGGIILLFAAVILIAAAVVLGLLLPEKPEEPKEAGSKPGVLYVSLSGEAAARAYIWLNRIDDMPFSYEEIRDRMGDISLQIVLTEGDAEGSLVQTIAEGSYETCERQAREGLEAVYREVLRARLLDAGFEGEASDELLDDLMREAYGVDVAEYLEQCGVELLPEKAGLEERYSGEVSHE